MSINDCHCHFFSRRFFELLAREKSGESSKSQVEQVTAQLGWEAPGSPAELAARWIRELDESGVDRAALIASVPGDQESVATAVKEYPKRLVGFFMVDPTRENAAEGVQWSLVDLGLRCICLFPAMHRYRVGEDRVLKIFDIAASLKAAVFVHCGVLSVGVRNKLNLPSRFAIHLSSPLDLHFVALTFPQVPIIIPHFGAGFFREALMVADLCPNIYLDTSSSNGWVKYHPGLSLQDVFERALEVVGPERLLFGTDSSFFPRGWQRTVWETQKDILDRLKVDSDSQESIFGDNFDRIFPPG